MRSIHSLCVFVAHLQVKVLPLFKDTAKFEPNVAGQKLEMEKILVYYVDEEPPTFTMKHLSGGIIAVIVVVVLAVVAGLLVLVSPYVHLLYCIRDYFFPLLICTVFMFLHFSPFFLSSSLPEGDSSSSTTRPR